MDIRTHVKTNFGDWNELFLEKWQDQVKVLKEKFSTAIEKTCFPPEYPTDVPIVFVNHEKIKEVLLFLKNEPGFDYQFLSDLTATDEGGEKRFEVVYQLYSQSEKCRIRLKVRVEESEMVPSVVTVWPAANWLEREVFDMFGVRFKDHPNLKRVLMDDRFEGHPLRKDYPLKGYQVFPTPQEVDLEQLK